MVQRGSVGLNHLKVMWNVATSIVSTVIYWFDKVQKSRTHVKLHHRSGLLCCAMVQTGSEQLNNPELMRDYLRSLFPLVLSGSLRFAMVEPHQTSDNLYHRSGSLCCATVWAGSKQLNYPELVPCPLALFCVLYLTRVRGGTRRPPLCAVIKFKTIFMRERDWKTTLVIN